MPQHDMVIANDTGANVRADINSALQSLATLSSGGSAPATTYAYQLWYDTAEGRVKIRNAANSGWEYFDQHLRNLYYIGTTSGNDTITAAPTPAVGAYVTGMIIVFKAGGTTTGASTINLNALGAKTIKTLAGSATVAGTITNGSSYMAIYDGTDFRLLTYGIGVDVQAYSAKLAAIVAASWGSNKIIRLTGANSCDLLDFKDEDNMVSNSDTALPSQQSVKAYVDAAVSGATTTGTLKAVTLFTSSGTWTKATNSPSFIVVETIGGGGGGSRSSTSSVTGGGGSAGGYSRKKIANGALSATETVTVGAGGSAGGNGTNGGNGGTTSFGAHCQATGGTGALFGAGKGQAAGAGSGGDLNLTGAMGQGSLAATAAGHCGGNGAPGFLGLGAGAGGSNSLGGGSSAAANTGAGGGGCADNSGVAGAGGSGLVIVYEYA